MKRVTLVAASLLAGFLSRLSSAAVVRVEFSGVVTRIDAAYQNREPPKNVLKDPVKALHRKLELGTPLSGYLTFDSEVTPDAVIPEQVAGEEIALYAIHVPFGAHVQVGSFAIDGLDPDTLPSDPPVPGYSVNVRDAERLVLFPSSANFLWTTGPVRVFRGSHLKLASVELDVSGGAPGLPLHGASLTSTPWTLDNFPYAQVVIDISGRYRGKSADIQVFVTIDHLDEVREP